MFFIKKLDALHYKSAADIYESAFDINCPLSRTWRYRSPLLSLGVCNKEGDLLGFSLAIGDHILYLAVHPFFQRKGVGTFLLQNILALSKMYRLSITLEPLEDVVPWYIANGFRKTSNNNMVYHNYFTRQKTTH